MSLVIQSLPVLLMGAGKTLQITALAVAIGIVLGLTGGLCRLSKRKFFRFIGTCYVDFFRGTPLLVQILIVYFGLPQILRAIQDHLAQAYGFPVIFHNIPIFVASVISCSMNSGAYIAEIFRAAVQSIDKGQMEAARSLGMTHAQAMRYVILPQAFKWAIPPLGNEFIAMMKDTSLLSVIGFEELLRRGQLIVGETFDAFTIFLEVAFIYLVMTLAFSRLVDYLERRLKTGD